MIQCLAMNTERFGQGFDAPWTLDVVFCWVQLAFTVVAEVSCSDVNRGNSTA